MSDINSRLANYLDNHSSMIKLTVAGNGEITKANKFAERLAGRPLSATPIKDFFTDFNARLDIEKLLQDEISNAILNVRSEEVV